MTIKDAIFVLNCVEAHGICIEAKEMAIQSLEAWEKVREDLQKFIDANSNSGDMYLDGRADGGWHALATIKRCLAEVENDERRSEHNNRQYTD